MAKVYFLFLAIISFFTNGIGAAVGEQQAAQVGLLRSFIDNFASISAKMEYFVFYKWEIAQGVEIRIVIAWLIIASVWFTIYMGFINLRGFKHAVELIQGKYINPDKNLGGKGEVSPFQALTAALSGTVGIGAIGGTAIAIGIGGMGAIFWIFMAGFFGMTMKFMECTLGVKYRNEYENGRVSGGPMYYISKGFAEYGYFMANLGKLFGMLYAIGIAIGALSIGNMFQSNQAYKQLNQVYTLMTDGPMTNGVANIGNLNPWLIGSIFGVIVFAVIIGGIKSIVKVTEKIVPFMAVLFLTFAVIVIIYNIKYIPQTFAEIFTGVFTAKGVAGGAVGCLMIAFQRAIFSNEAGIGSASVAHSAVKTEHPPTEGFVALLEPFFGTIIILFISALVIGTSQIADPSIRETLDLVRENAFNILNNPDYIPGSNGAGDIKGIVIASNAFERVFPWFPYPLAIAACLFAFSTMIAWAYYGLKGWTYVFGESMISEVSYKLLYCIFIVVGAVASLKSVLSFGDAMTYFICIPNIIAIYLLGPKVKREASIYFTKIKSGEIKKYS
ncbi:MAG: alanine:cation symporter family protein [Bdellovibrionales bacterium]|jgi:alanine or glycine:cation symporter, AGCS family|nr:alanine:cation symporter family protein [Bdellovibrionales bacterium]MBT3527164.1 alanine:cation symporter family protein [Bdellovibrionales bacterium]MBT7670035.1 alanine:cation symporter family protein [Bdellovibrionales bacterium]MBT7767179.1 alanine:cation symporter family protein [Bdellovibrionales bacterium]